LFELLGMFGGVPAADHYWRGICIGAGHSKELETEINRRLESNEEYLKRYPGGAKVNHMTISRALRAMRKANR
jgi:hypothetical protein